MRYIITAAIAASLVAFASLTTPAQAVKVYAVIGTVSHVSTDNVKVYVWETHKVESFLLIPRFKNVFSKDGKTTYEMAELRSGMDVDVHYSTPLGIRHASQIYIINAHGHVLKAVKG